MRCVAFPDGRVVPALGQGTWMMGEDRRRRAQEVSALRRGIDLGMTLIDTAEMYAEGGAESVVGEAIAGRRDEVFLVSKAYPQNASLARLQRSCDASLDRLGTDRLDLYLLHWRGSVPLGEVVEAMDRLITAGKILRWGVSNFDVEDMNELIEAGGASCATDQVLFNLTRRGPELELLPWLSARSIPTMAYSPVEQGRLASHPVLEAVARRIDASPAQVALAWLLRRPDVIAIPKASLLDHVEDNRRAAGLDLSEEDFAVLGEAFPAPTRRRPLEML